MKKMKTWRLTFAMLAVFSLASCSSDDDNEDKVEQVTVYVSAETGLFYNVPNSNCSTMFRDSRLTEELSVCMA